MRSSLAIFSVIALTACTQEYVTWEKNSPTAPDLQVAFYECERDTRMAARSFGSGFAAQAEAEAFFGRCMSTKGYYQQRSTVERPVVSSSFARKFNAWRERFMECARITRTDAERDACAGPPPENTGT
jgi:hypothetical protein